MWTLSKPNLRYGLFLIMDYNNDSTWKHTIERCKEFLTAFFCPASWIGTKEVTSFHKETLGLWLWLVHKKQIESSIALFVFCYLTVN